MPAEQVVAQQVQAPEPMTTQSSSVEVDQPVRLCAPLPNL